MSLPLTDANGVVQTIANGTPVVWNAGLGYDANGLLCVTSTLSATDVWINGWRRDTQGRLVVSQSSPEGQPFIYNAGWPTDKNTGAIITQQNIPTPTDPRIAGVAVGPLGGVYMTEGGYIWTPLALWPDGVNSPGMWIDPSNLASQWQDSTGTTPVSTPGTVADSSNPVGLALDIRAGTPVLGPELVTNGGFDTDTAWSKSAGVTISGGTANWTAASSAPLYQGVGTVGSFVEITFTVISCSSGGFSAMGNGTVGPVRSTPGTYSDRVMVIGGPNVGIFSAASTTGSIDNISVREIPGNHMLQSTSAARPLESARVNLLVQTENLANAAWFSTVSGSTITTGVSDPLGGTTAFTITANTTNGQAYQNLGSITIPRIASGYIRRRTGTGVVKFYADGGAAGTDITSQVTASWTPFSVASSTNFGCWYVLLQTAGDAIDVWHPQVESGLVSTQYQRVGAASDYDATGITPFQLYDGTDDGMATASFAAGTLTSAMDCMIAVRRDSAESMVVGLYSGAGTTKFIGAAESGSIADCFNGVGAPTVWVDGTQLTGETAVTRTTLHTALTAGSFHILEFRGLNLSTWTTAEAGGYGSGYNLNGALGDILLYPSTASTEDKDNAREYLAEYYGVTLP